MAKNHLQICTKAQRYAKVIHSFTVNFNNCNQIKFLKALKLDSHKNHIQKSFGKSSCWIIDSVIDHTISISKYNSLVGSSYNKLPKELDHPRKELINIQNIDDNECFKWCLVRYLNPVDHNPKRMTKADQEFGKKLDFKNIKFPVKIRDIHKIEKRIPSALVLFGHKNKEKRPIYVPKKRCEKKHVDFQEKTEKDRRRKRWKIYKKLIGEERKRHLLIKDFNTFMFDHTLHRGRNIFVHIVYMLLVQKNYEKVILKAALKLMAKIES